MTVTINAQSFTATYNFDGTPPVVAGLVTGDGSSLVTASNFSNTGYGTTTTGNRFAHTGAPTDTAPDLTKYFEVTITPSTDYAVSISSVTFRSQRSGTGPRYYIVRSNVDGYAANLPASINPANAELEVVGSNEFHFVNDLSGGQNGSTVSPAISNSSTPVTFRFYYYGSEATSGTFSVDDVVITGTVSSTLAVSDVEAGKLKFIKNTLVDNTIEFSAKANVKIYNVNGQMVKEAAVNNGTRLDVSNLAKGMYIVAGEVDGQAATAKIIKK